MTVGDCIHVHTLSELASFLTHGLSLTCGWYPPRACVVIKEAHAGQARGMVPLANSNQSQALTAHILRQLGHLSSIELILCASYIYRQHEGEDVKSFLNATCKATCKYWMEPG